MTSGARSGNIILALAPVAQLDRVSDYESEGRGFESLPAHQGFPEMGSLFLLLSSGRRSVCPGRDSNSSSGRFASRPGPTVQRTVGESAGRGAPSGAPRFPRNGKPFFVAIVRKAVRLSRKGLEQLVRPVCVPAGSHSPADCGRERGQRGPFRRTKVSQKWEAFFVCFRHCGKTPVVLHWAQKDLRPVRGGAKRGVWRAGRLMV